MFQKARCINQFPPPPAFCTASITRKKAHNMHFLGVVATQRSRNPLTLALHVMADCLAASSVF
jgi:hypothetical protein